MKLLAPWGISALTALLGTWNVRAAVPPEPLPYAVPAKLPDAAEALSPAAVHVGGWLGNRIEANTRNRLAKMDVEPLLAGFRQKPGVHPWIGEHLGKWMHAGTLAWANSNDAPLRAKLDYAVAELIKAQEADGYLGTYPADKRFGLYAGADWDVWSHKYCLLGLLTYYQYTGNAAALAAAKKAGDLLVKTFPAQRSILAAGTHMGMAATSVLEPMVLLYRCTGDRRYLEFCQYLVKSWSEPDGPKLLESLGAGKGVNETANGKAYEMLSNLVGLCELARVTGEAALLKPVIHAWEDIVTNRRYLTGSASQAEHFRSDHHLPNQMGANVSETCVTTTWIQLNQQLLRLTGEARFGAELERTFYNHLAAAQRPDGAEWCYFTSLEGTKPYGPGINCCVSSGPRGMALAAQQVCLRTRAGTNDVLLVNLLDPSRVVIDLGGEAVTVEHQSGFPRTGGSLFTFFMDRPATFGFKVRAAAWTGPMSAKLNGKPVKLAPQAGWLELPARRWQNGDKLTLGYTIGARVVAGEHGNSGRSALEWGPFVLALDTQRNAGLGAPGNAVLLTGSKPAARLLPGDDLRWSVPVQTARAASPMKAVLVPFADAGRDGGRYAVWLRQPGSPLSQNESLLAEGNESRSRAGNRAGSINDGNPATFVVTFDGEAAAEDWYAVKLAAPWKLKRVAFTHGQTFHDGGWFDTRTGKPRIQVIRRGGKDWVTVGELAAYPATTATDSAGLKDGQRFVVELTEPSKVMAVRVIGTPAAGDNPAQAFSSCGELEALGD